MKAFIPAILCAATAALSAAGADPAASDYDSFRRAAFEKYDANSARAREEYNNFRRAVNEAYAELMERSWVKVKPAPAVQRPEEKPSPTPPVYAPTPQPAVPEEQPLPPVTPPTPAPPAPSPLPEEPAPAPVVEVIPDPEPLPQPQPIVPIEAIAPEPTPTPLPAMEVALYGTPLSFTQTPPPLLLDNLTDSELPEAWLAVAAGDYDALLAECLTLRDALDLCDWAYLTMLGEVSDKVCGKGTNGAALLLGYLYSQSGYRMRFALEGGKLLMLFGSLHTIYDRSFFTMDGMDFYPYSDGNPTQLYICNLPFPEEQSLSLQIDRLPKLADNLTPPRRLRSEGNPCELAISSDLNRIAFYNTFPSSHINNNPMTRWAIYAQTPLPAHILEEAAKRFTADLPLHGLPQLLDWVQNAFTYALDNEVWGHDRPFFPEETIHYPYSDCEDRAILFCRLVRDIMGLDAALLYYPNHLAAAVCLPPAYDSASYHHLTIDDRTFTICDPTYLGAPIGLPMRDYVDVLPRAILVK